MKLLVCAAVLISTSVEGQDGTHVEGEDGLSGWFGFGPWSSANKLTISSVMELLSGGTVFSDASPSGNIPVQPSLSTESPVRIPGRQTTPGISSTQAPLETIASDFLKLLERVASGTETIPMAFVRMEVERLNRKLYSNFGYKLAILSDCPELKNVDLGIPILSTAKDILHGKDTEKVKHVDHHQDHQDAGVVADVKIDENVDRTRSKRSVLATGDVGQEQQQQEQTADNVGKSSESDKTQVIDGQVGQVKTLDTEQIRRLDQDVGGVEPVVPEAVAAVSDIASPSIVDNNQIQVSQANDGVNQVQPTVDEVVKSASPVDTVQGIAKSQVHEKNEYRFVYPDDPILSVQTEPIVAATRDNAPASPTSSSTFPRLQYWKDQALLLQEQILNNTFVQAVQKRVATMLPGIARISDQEYLGLVRTIMEKEKIPESNEVDTSALRAKGLTEDQIEIIKCTQQLYAQKGRQSFTENMTQCIQGLNIANCMRIFIYPIVVEYMPEAFTRALSGLPYEINLSEAFRSKDKIKVTRQVPILGLIMNPIDPDALVHNILSDGLLRNTAYEDYPSYISANNESFSKLLSCSKMSILQMTEKFLPENARQGYTDEMLSCIKRFEYFSCIKYYAWPMLRQYNPSLAQFPLSDSYVASLTSQNYPLLTYPGYEPGFTQPPEIIESGPARNRIETIIAQILRNNINTYSRAAPPSLPPQLDFLTRNSQMTPEQLNSIYLAEQLLPADIRYEYVTKTLQCVAQFDYYNCMKYSTWPLLRQVNPSLPAFPSIQYFIDRVTTPKPPADFPSIPSAPSIPSPPSVPSVPEVPSPPPVPSIPSYPGQNQPGQQNDTAAGFRRHQSAALESRLYQILKTVRESMEATRFAPLPYTENQVYIFPLMTKDQSRIFGLAEDILPPLAREPLMTSTYFCLNDKNEFSTCFKTIMWPFIRSYVRDLPEFPAEYERGIFGTIPSIPNAFPNTPNAIPNPIPSFPTGDNFFILKEIGKFFAEGSETAMQYIIESVKTFGQGFNIQKLVEVMRNIQSNSREFINAPTPQYPRIPDFFNILSATQENVVHAAEYIVPQQYRQKYQEDMIKCVRAKPFPACSYEIIFPYVSSYIKNALSTPLNFNNNNLANRDSIKSNDIDPSRIWTKAFPENQGLNAPLSNNQLDSKASQLSSSEPESVILSMLRYYQMTARRLPESPKLSIANTPEFARVFNTTRRALIPTIAEALLPEESRKEFLPQMFECAQKFTFLECSRDILYPTLRAAYPDFPAYPDFEHELDKSQISSMIQILEQKSLTPELITEFRSLPEMDNLYKYATEDKAPYLKYLIAKLPDTLYYDAYLKMSQCAQFSDGLYCSHDIVYPILKQYYNAPEINIDEYYPITAQPAINPSLLNQRSPFDYEMFCENMGLVCTLTPYGTRQGLPSHLSSSSLESPVIPFGRVRDGSRIFKHTQDIWDSNITTSVGADKTTTSGATSHSSTTSNRQELIKVHDSSNHFSNQLTDSSNRVKRNVDDLLDSYSDSIPDDKKNSTPKRVPSDLTVETLTETEYLQILVHESNSRNKHLSGNEDLTVRDYFVDTLDDKDKELLTADQYEILKLVQRLNDETAKASFMSKLFRCIRSLSFIRCMGIFVWPMISNNLPQVLPFSLPDSRNDRATDEGHLQEIFRKTPAEIEIELLDRKKQIESKLVHLYKKLTEEEFEMTVGSMKVHGHGDGELSLNFPNNREGRYSEFKDNKNLPSVLNAVSEVIDGIFDAKPEKLRNRKELKKSRSLHNYEESHFGKFLRRSSNAKDSERSLQDERVINILLDKIRPSTGGLKDEEIKYHPNFDDAYRAFQVLFGPKVTAKLASHLTALKIEDLRNFEENLESIKHGDAIKVVPLESQRKFHSKKSKTLNRRGHSLFMPTRTSRKLDITEENSVMPDLLFHLKKHIVEYVKNRLKLDQEDKTTETGLTVHLPKLHENISIDRESKIEDASEGRGKKKGGGGGGGEMMHKMMPAAGMVGMMMMHMGMAHAKAAASVANLLSNMALASAVLGMVKDMMMGNSDQPKIKYVYESEQKPSHPWSADRLGGLKTSQTLFPPSPPVFTEPY
ncbi:hypothetical protein QAD02_015162 [Eretmocerus hayati]|uniref:Uncharacterized protein n=1 Tax=Eretmocerus hayati TaxID=131215 RepID=A0ACC2P706_9HYME|nr:hypothetical protein QAD02_015162 [Eretmocerus hayati]